MIDLVEEMAHIPENVSHIEKNVLSNDEWCSYLRMNMTIQMTMKENMSIYLLAKSISVSIFLYYLEHNFRFQLKEKHITHPFKIHTLYDFVYCLNFSV